VLQKDLALAFELADLVAEVSMKAFGRADLGVETKADGSPVTEVDRIIEGVLREELARYMRDDRVVGEEFGGEPGSGRCWYLDPIDGTVAYIEHEDRWATLISLTVDGVVTMGVVDLPATKHRFWAARGEGAFADGDPMHVSSITRLEEATICDDYHHNFERQTEGHPLVRLASQCPSVHPHDVHSMLVVAQGKADIALGMGGGPWDYAPFVVLVEESGGVATDLEGHPRFDGGSLLVTNGRVHSHAVTTLNG
jgi:histidinol-phosphatase